MTTPAPVAGAAPAAGTAAASGTAPASAAGAAPAPLATVIMPAYNVEAYVQQAVRSVLAQTMGDFELLVVDDGSTDSTGAVLDALADGDARMRVFHVSNGGAPAARNLALDAARGRYTLFVDADDECAPRLLEELCALMADGAELAVCGFQIVTTAGYGDGSAGAPNAASAPRAASPAPAAAAAAARSDGGGRAFVETKQVPAARYDDAASFRAASPALFDANMLYPPWNKLFLTERLERLHIRFRNVFWDDFPFVLDYIRDVERVAVTDEPLYRFYRRRADSETSRYRPGVFEKRETEHRWMQELYEHWGLADDPQAREMVARRYVERLVGCVANECSPANPATPAEQRAAVAGMLASPALPQALADARPRSLKMRLMLVPYRRRDARACVGFARLINRVRAACPTLFARLKASR